jgi:hypothetical protein
MQMAKPPDLFPCALSKRQLARSMRLHPRHIDQMIEEGLPVYKVPNSTSHRIFVLDACLHAAQHWERIQPKGNPHE